MSPTLEEVYVKAKYLYEQGPAHRQRKCHFGLIDVELKERRLNPDKGKRFVVVADKITVDELRLMKDRYFSLCFDNPNIAWPVILDLLARVPDETIRALAEADRKEEDAEGI